MVGQHILVIAKQEHLNRFSKVSKLMVKTGFDGMTGNKGAVTIRFDFDDSTFKFVNVHLESGDKCIAERLENLRQIHVDTFNHSSKMLTDPQYFYHDYKFILGDTNFRINKPY